MIRLSIIILLALLSFTEDSQAQTVPGCTGSYQIIPTIASTCTDAGLAEQMKQSHIDYYKQYFTAQGQYGGHLNEPTTYGDGNTNLNYRQSNLYNWHYSVVAYPSGATCETRAAPTGSGQFNAAEHGDIRCNLGCQQILDQGASSWTFDSYQNKTCSTQTWGASQCPPNSVFNVTYSVCEALPPDADSDGVPDTEDEWPTDPTRTKDTDGDGVADEYDAFPADPTQSQDTDNDGIGDSFDHMPNDPDNGQDSGVGNETDNTSSGGASCSSPPVSSGDAITAQIAYQTWATRCAAETSNEKLDQVKSAIQAQGSNGGSGSVTVNVSNSLDANSNGTPDYLEGSEADLSGEPTGEEALESSAAADSRAQDALNSIDTSGFLANSSCPGLPPIHVMGQTFDMSQQVCDQASVFAGLIQAFAMFAAAVIIARGMSY